MSEMQQGEEYVEEDIEDINAQFEDEGDEDTDAPIDTILGFPKQYVYIAGVIILVLIIGAVVLSTRSKKVKEEDIVYPEQNPIYQEIQTEVVEPEPEQEEIAVGTELNGYVWDGTAWVEAVSPLDDETNKKLRAMGYTGDEIEYALRNGFNVEYLIEAAQELYDIEAKEALIRMSDSASDEFKYIIDNTYFGQVGYEFVPQKNLDIGDVHLKSSYFVVNADYVKCPTYGSQLQLKCKVASDLYVWYIITPQRWEELPDKGNIVLRVDYTEYGPNLYVTSVREVDSTLDTIDAAENDDTLEEIVDDNATPDEVVLEVEDENSSN